MRNVQGVCDVLVIDDPALIQGSAKSIWETIPAFDF